MRRTQYNGLSVKKTLERLDLGIYWFWAALRVLLTLIPQTGYIHPDEFFQTTEVFVGNVFDVEVSLPWEFNTTNPIRSVVLTSTFIQLPLMLLKVLSEFIRFYFGINIISSYMLLVIPRLCMCLVSFISDYCLYRMCYLYGQNYKERLVMFSSSYVTLIYMSRTFNNNLEILCFNLLLLFVATSMAESEKINYQNAYLQTKYEDASTPADRVRILKLMKLLPPHSLNRCLFVSTICVAGFFNRPTFLCYALPPVFYWIQRGMGSNHVTYIKDFHSRILLLIIYALPSACLFIFFDSAYYGYITWAEVLNKKIDTNNFVVTPLNFLKYNIKQDNLSKHGIHPRFLHLLINVPLLFNVLGIAAIIVIFKLCYRGSQFYWTLLPKPQSITGLMTFSFLFPLATLSLIPHQEPRFITPLLLPLVFLYSHMIRDFEEHCKSVIPFRKRHPQRLHEVPGLLNFPVKCINYFSKMTENFDNRYNVYGRFLSSIKNAENERRVYEQKKKMREKLGKESDETTTEDEEDEQEEKSNEKKQEMRKSQKLLILWHVLNILSVIFFGFVHQGGIHGLTSHFSRYSKAHDRWHNVHLVTSHTYSIPFHLMNIKNTKQTRLSIDGKRYQLSSTFFLYELGSTQLDKVHSKIKTIFKVGEERKQLKVNYELYYAFPATIYELFESKSRNYSDFSYDIVTTFYPHISFEAPPQFNYPHNFHNATTSQSSIFFYFNLFINFIEQFQLILIKIRPNT